VFVPGCALRLAQECDLMVCGANHRLVLPARVVYVDEHRGAGLELVGFSHDMKARLAELEPMLRPTLPSLEPPVVVESPPQPDDSLLDLAIAEDEHHTEPVPLVVLDALEALEDDLALQLLDPVDGDPLPEGDPEAGHRADPAGSPDHFDDLEEFSATADTAAFYAADVGDSRDTVRGLSPLYAAADGLEPADAQGDAEDATGSRRRRETTRPFARNVHERLRGLNLAAQLKLAVTGELHERIVLERLYGKNVWETLLRNPRLTAPEVARIARYGSLPRVLLEIIVGNNAWLQIPEVRRALLSNPRLGTDQVVKVLRLTPKHELKLAAIQTAYPAAVRNAAKMMLRE
jgi:hypothetical protein